MSLIKLDVSKGSPVDRTDISLIALRRILRATELYGRELARTAGLTPVQIRVLQIIDAHGNSTPKKISLQMGVSQATMSTLLERLQAKGLLTREKSEVDRRQTNVLLTPKGKLAIDDSPDPLQQKYVREFEALPGWEQAMIVSVLERVASMLNASDLDASPVLHMGEIRRAHEE
ncbi:MAG: MarR family transcriptional regulator [Celeribacter sp.]|jgi:DNA-binding MarR family transcriptional regulator